MYFDEKNFEIYSFEPVFFIEIGFGKDFVFLYLFIKIVRFRPF